MTQTLLSLSAIDDELSKRFIELDPAGYFIISLDRQAQLILAEHYSNIITDKGLAADPETGEVIVCSGGIKRSPDQCYSARTAKELCVQLFESGVVSPVTMFDHAAYLGRELVRAEIALISGAEYIQD
jgi:dihydropteroate synthase